MRFTSWSTFLIIAPLEWVKTCMKLAGYIAALSFSNIISNRFLRERFNSYEHNCYHNY